MYNRLTKTLKVENSDENTNKGFKILHWNRRETKPNYNEFLTLITRLLHPENISKNKKLILKTIN